MELMSCAAHVVTAGVARPRLSDYDLVLVNTSGGKDSLAMLWYLLGLADAEGYDRARIVVVHADLARVEWDGTRELAQSHAEAFGLRFEVVRRELGDLLEQVRQRRDSLDAAAMALVGEAGVLRGAGLDAFARLADDDARKRWNAPAWPGPGNARWCTSDQKTAQVAKLITRLAAEWHEANPDAGRPIRILQCLGMRAEESADRAKAEPFRRNTKNSNKTVKLVDDWLPIHSWLLADVWAAVDASGLPRHPAYALGMSRASCVFCIYATLRELVLAARHKPELAAEYRATEIYARSTFKAGLGFEQIIAAAEAEEAAAAA